MRTVLCPLFGLLVGAHLLVAPVIAGEFQGQAPVNGDKWLVGSAQTIRWRMHGKMDSVKVELCTIAVGCVPLSGSPVLASE